MTGTISVSSCGAASGQDLPCNCCASEGSTVRSMCAEIGRVIAENACPMKIHQERQIGAVADEVLALTACVRPILTGVLYSLKQDVVAEIGGYENVKLKMLPRLRREHDGDCGVCFEYAVHDAMNSGDQRVLDRIAEASKLCKVPGQSPPKSLLFGLEKSGTQQLIDTAREILTDDSSVLNPKSVSF